MHRTPGHPRAQRVHRQSSFLEREATAWAISAFMSAARSVVRSNWKCSVDTGVKANDDGLGSNREIDVGLADATDSGVDQLDLDFVGRELEQ